MTKAILGAALAAATLIGSVAAVAQNVTAPAALAAPGAAPGAAMAPGSAGADPVKRAQANLQRLGLFAGPVDGVVGPRMRDAIIRFEAARRLAIDPRVSDRLLAALEEDGAEGGTTRPPAPGST